MSSNCLVFHTSGGISSSPAAFLFSIFLRTESSSSCVNGPSLMSNCLLIILVIGSCVIFGGFTSKFSKCCFHSFILSCWFAALSFALSVLSLQENAKQTETTKHYDWALLNNRDMRDKYVLELRNRFETLQEKTEKKYTK